MIDGDLSYVILTVSEKSAYSSQSIVEAQSISKAGRGASLWRGSCGFVRLAGQVDRVALGDPLEEEEASYIAEFGAWMSWLLPGFLAGAAGFCLIFRSVLATTSMLVGDCPK